MHENTQPALLLGLLRFGSGSCGVSHGWPSLEEKMRCLGMSTLSLLEARGVSRRECTTLCFTSALCSGVRASWVWGLCTIAFWAGPLWAKSANVTSVAPLLPSPPTVIIALGAWDALRRPLLSSVFVSCLYHKYPPLRRAPRCRAMSNDHTS